MQVTLSIDAASCIRCGKCVKVCPSSILTQNKAGADVVPVNVETCIVCGHCAAACPTGSVRHNQFPAEKVHPIDRSNMPTPEQVMLLCKARRSNRAFSNKPIPQESLRQILEAAHSAPTASNKQQVSYTLITDPEKLRAVGQFTIDTFEGIARKLQNPLMRPALKLIIPDVYRYLPIFRRLKTEFDKGNDKILRGATALILIHTPAGNNFGSIDSNLAYQNGSLMAESLGVSQFYTGFVLNALNQAGSSKRKALMQLLQIEGKVHAGMGLGIPQFLFPNYVDKKPLDAKIE